MIMLKYLICVIYVLVEDNLEIIRFFVLKFILDM